MPDTVYLVGSDQVQTAGYRMREAAESFRTSVTYMQEILELHRRWMDEWLEQFKAALLEEPHA